MARHWSDNGFNTSTYFCPKARGGGGGTMWGGGGGMIGERRGQCGVVEEG